MNLLCRIIGHKYICVATGTEEPYEGKHRVNGHKPYKRCISFLGCQRCSNAEKLNHYFFEYCDDMEIPE
jgi:hypothetical protein